MDAMHVKITLLLIAAFMNVGLGALVLYRTYRHAYGWFFSMINFSAAAWTFGVVAVLSASRAPDLAMAVRLLYIAPMIIPLAMVMFLASFPSRRTYGRLGVLCAVIFVLASLVITARWDWFIAGFARAGKFNYPVPAEPGFTIYTFGFLLVFVLIYVVFYRAYHHQRQVLAKAQLQYMFIAVVLASVPALTTNLLLPIFGHPLYLWLGPLFTTMFVVAMAISIVRHRMFDIRLAIARTIGYGGSILVMATFYGFVIFGLLNYALKLQVPGGLQIFISVATGVAVLAFRRLRVTFDRITNRLFYRDAYESQDLFDRLNQTLVTNPELSRLLGRSAELITATVKAEYGLFMLEDGPHRYRIFGTIKPKYDPKDIERLRQLAPQMGQSVIATDFLDESDAALRVVLERNEIAVLTRLVSDAPKDAPKGTAEAAAGIGYFMLGPKQSGNPYNRQDFRVLGTIADELIIAVQNSLHFEEIQAFSLTLQSRVDEATRQLRRTNRKLELLDETKDDFISMASHQLRTPLTSVKGYISMVMDGDGGRVSALQKKMLGQAFISSQRMVFLIADLLNVSRLKTGKFVIEPAPTNLAKIIKEEVGQLRETAVSRSVELIYDKPADFPDIMLDETKTRQVIMNFIDNAIYYTRPGGHITVRLVEKPKTIELRVIDDGIGVPKAEQYHLFTKFYRAPNAQKARPDGTGLGLFMAKKVVAAQHGSIIFESQENKGSTFGFILPKTPPPHTATVEKPTVSSGEALETSAP